MATNKLFPPQLDGTLPAFYKHYGEDNELIGANINIPFSLGRAISIIEIAGLSMRISTVSTNTLIATVQTDVFELTDNNLAYFTLNKNTAEKLNEGQYYRIQLAYINQDEIIGYYSTVGIIKCIAKPTCSIDGFSIAQVNIFRTTLIGLYEQDTTFGDTTEKVYRYRFLLTDKNGNTVTDSDWLLHDATQDTDSEFSKDTYNVYTELDKGEIGTIEYMVETINGLVISSPPYEIMHMESVDLEYPLEIYTKANFDDGCIELFLHGVYNHGIAGEEDITAGQEAVYSGTFVITRADEYSNYKEWREITRFIISGDYASHFAFRDFTVEQGVYYRYGIQQYNSNYMYSEKVLSFDMTPFWIVGDSKEIRDEAMRKAKAAQQGAVRADFEDMFLFDGERQLKIRFNPKVTSFKSTRLEQKVDTIGSKYPFIFKNGHTNYKEFPIGGLISYTADDSVLFLFDKEIQDAHILGTDQIRRRSNPYGSIPEQIGDIIYRRNYTGSDKYAFWEQMYYYNDIEIKDPKTRVVSKKRDYVKYTEKQLISRKQIIDAKAQEGTVLKGITYYDPILTGDYSTSYDRRDLWLYSINDRINARPVEGVVRQNRDITSENVTAERFFKLKVLEWLNDGNVKLFKSPTEGNYLVRLINTQLQPQEQLGRLIHSFTSQAYEIDDISYDKLVLYKIISKSTPIITSTLWKSIDLKQTLLEQKDDTYTDIDFEHRIPLHLYFDDFMPGDIIKINYSDGGPFYYTIGATGNLNLGNEERTIISVSISKAPDAYDEFDPIEYSRILTYSYIGLGSSRFDAVFDLGTSIPVAETFVGPKEDLLTPLDLTPNEEWYNDESYRETENYMVNGKGNTPGILSALKAREHINIQIGPYADKFRAITFEVLHARKRNIIPIFACENLAWDEDNKQFVLQFAAPQQKDEEGNVINYGSESTLFCTTPFDIGYINSKMLYTIDSIKRQVYAIEPEDLPDANNIHMVSLEQIQTEGLADFTNFKVEGYDLLKVYVPKVVESTESEVIFSRGEVIENNIDIDETLIGITNDFSWTFDRTVNCEQINILVKTRNDVVRLINTQTQNIDGVYTGQREYYLPKPANNQTIRIQIANVGGFDPDYYDIFQGEKNITKKLVPAMQYDTIFHDNYKKYSTNSDDFLYTIDIPETVFDDIQTVINLIMSQQETIITEDDQEIIEDEDARNCVNSLQTLLDLLNQNKNIDNKIHTKDQELVHNLISSILIYVNENNIQCNSLKQSLSVLNKIGTIEYTYGLSDIGQPETIYNSFFDAWQENPDHNYLYYDTYTNTWWPEDWEYDPTFTVTTVPEFDPNIIYTNVKNALEYNTIYSNPLVLGHPDGTLALNPIIDPLTNTVTPRTNLDNAVGKPVDLSSGAMMDIDLNNIDEFVITDMHAPDKLRIGTGVIIEVTPRLQIVEYNVEHKLNECYDYKKAYLEAKQKYHDLLVSTYKDASEIDAKIASYRRLVELYEEAQTQIDKLQNAVDETDVLANALIDRLTSIDYDMYELQNEYLNQMYNIFKDLKLPLTMEDTVEDFVPLLTDETHTDYLNYINAASDNYELTNRTIYNRNYYYNTRVNQFYYNADPSDQDSAFVPSEVLSFYQRTETDENDITTTKWDAGTDNGVYTLWSSSGNGDIYYNEMLNKLLKNLFTTVLPGTNVAVYTYMDNLYNEIGRIPAYIHTYGDYRNWLRTLLNKKVGEAYALIHYYDTIPEDTDHVILNDPLHLFEVVNDTENETTEIINHPYLKAYMKYDESTFTNGLLYMYLSGSNNNVYRNQNLTEKILLNSEYNKLLLPLVINPDSGEEVLKNETKDSFNELNEKALELINHPDILAQRNNLPLQPSICTYNVKVLWNIEKDYYYQPIWLWEGINGYGPGFYGVYLFTDTGRSKVRQVDKETFNRYSRAVTQFENITEETTEEEKGNIVYAINANYESLVEQYEELRTTSPSWKALDICQYQPVGEAARSMQVEYEVIEKYPRDYYYDAYGRIIFNNSSDRYFDYPISLINPFDEATQTYYLDYLGDNTIDFWSQVNGLLVDDPEEDPLADKPSDIDEDSALAAYYNTFDKYQYSFAKNTVLNKYYEWQSLSEGLSKIEQEYQDWGEAKTTRAGYTGEKLVDIEPIEEDLKTLQDTFNRLQYQMRSAVTILVTELEADNMSVRKYNQLIDLIAGIIDTTGMGEEEFVRFCNLNLSNKIDKSIVDDLKTMKNDFNESIFDQEESLIKQINQLFIDNQYNPTVGYIVDRNGQVYTYQTYSTLIDKDAKRALLLAMPEDVMEQIDTLVNQINKYVKKYNTIRYKYLIRSKSDELYDINNAVILRIREGFITEINDLKGKTIQAKKDYDTIFRRYLNMINALNDLFWNTDPTNLGINELLLKYHGTIRNGKRDTDSLNDSSISGAIHAYWQGIEDFLHLYYATQLHDRVDKNNNTVHGTEYRDIMTRIPYESAYGTEYVQIENKNYNDEESENYLEKNADILFDDYTINYEILESLNSIQKNYTDAIHELQDKQADYTKEQQALGKWDESNIPKDVNVKKEADKIISALAWYLASLGYRYYNEVEELYKR